MITVDLFADGTLHSHTNDGRHSHDPERMRRPVPVRDLLAKFGRSVKTQAYLGRHYEQTESFRSLGERALQYVVRHDVAGYGPAAARELARRAE